MQCFVLLVIMHIKLLNIILSSVLFKEKWNTCLYYFKLYFFIYFIVWDIHRRKLTLRIDSQMKDQLLVVRGRC